MSTTIILKRSEVAGSAPTTDDIVTGELAVNTYDGKIYMKKDVTGTESIVEVGASASSLSDVTESLSSLTSETLDAADYLLVYDTSATTIKKILISDLATYLTPT